MGFVSSNIITTINSKGKEMEIYNSKDSVSFIIIDKKNELVLVTEQKRMIKKDDKLEEKYVVSALGGYLEESDLSTRKGLFRELKEETNLIEKDIKALVCIYDRKLVSVGYSTERNTLLVLDVENLKQKFNTIKCLDEHEDIQFKLFTFYQMEEFAMSGIEMCMRLSIGWTIIEWEWKMRKEMAKYHESFN